MPMTPILVATDFSEGSRAALEQGVRLAEAWGAELYVVHVIRHEAADEFADLVAQSEGEAIRRLTSAAETELTQELAGLPLASPPSVRVTMGSPSGEIISAVEQSGAGLLVMGATGGSGRRFGTVAGRCVRKSTASVMLVPESQRGGFERIVAGVDFSPASGPLVSRAAELARLDACELHILHVCQVAWESARWGGVPSNAIALEQEMRARLAAQYADQLAPLVSGVQATFEVETHADYGAGLMEHAAKWRADLVAVGTTGRSKIASLLLGSTAEKVMRETPCAVLAVKP